MKKNDLNKSFKEAENILKSGDYISAQENFFVILQKFPKNKKANEYFNHIRKIILPVNGKQSRGLPEHIKSVLYSNLNKENYDEVLRFTKNILENFPQFYYCWMFRGLAYRRRDDYAKALLCFENMLYVDPKSSENLNNLGLAYRDMGLYDDALKKFSQAIIINKKFTDPIFNSGLALIDKGDYQGSIKAFTDYLKLCPESSEAYYHIGKSYSNNNQPNHAIKYFKKSIKLNNQLIIAYPDLAQEFSRIRDYQNSEKVYKEWEKVNANNPVLYNLYGNMLYSIGRWEDALIQYNLAFERGYLQKEIFYNIGNTYRMLRNLKDAITYYKKSLEIDPHFAECLNHLGYTHFLNDDFDDSEKYLRQAIKVNPRLSEAYLNLANLLASIDKFDDAIKVYDDAIRINDRYADAYRNKGLLMSNMGRIEVAKKLFLVAIDIDENYVAAWKNLSRIHKFLDISDPLLKRLEKLRVVDGLSDRERSSLHFSLAKAYSDLKQYEKAFENYNFANALRKKIVNFHALDDFLSFQRLKAIAGKFPSISTRNLEPRRIVQPVFIVGMPRSGTSLVEQILAGHSKIVAKGELEDINNSINKYEDIESAGLEKVVSDVRQSYQKHLCDHRSNIRYITDKMPHNFRYIPILFAAFPDAKIVHVYRDARATCWSNYEQDFEADDLGYCWDLADTVKHYNLYIDLITYYCREYKDQIYNQSYDSLVTNPRGQTCELLDYLGLQWEDACGEPEKNARVVKTASALQVRRKIYSGSSERWKNYEQFLPEEFTQLKSFNN